MKTFEFFVEGRKCNVIKNHVFGPHYVLSRQYLCRVPRRKKNNGVVTSYWFSQNRKTGDWSCTEVINEKGKAMHKINAVRVGHFEVLETETRKRA